MQQKSKSLLYFSVFVSLLLLAYTIYRACVLSLTIDETSTFLTFVPLNFMDIISDKIISANNHILNTLLIKLFASMFGNSEIVLRFPSLIGHVIYLVSSYLIVKKIKNPVIAFSGFVLLNFNPFLLDFFSLARGYALCAACTLASLNFTLDYFLIKGKKQLLLSFLFSFLAVLANFSALVLYVSMVIIFTFMLWLEYRNIDNGIKLFFRKYSYILVCTGSLFGLLYEPIRRLFKYNALYFGGEHGFWTDTIGSLINLTLYYRPYNNFFSLLLKILIIGVLACSFIFITNSAIKKNTLANNGLLLITLPMLVLPCLISICQHLIIGSKFLENRMGLFFIPLFMVNVLFLADSINFTVLWRRISAAMTLITAGIFIYITMNAINFKYVLLWRFDCQTNEMIQDIETINEKNGNPVSLGVSLFYEPATSYYKMRKNLDWLTIINTSVSKSSCDYEYLMAEERCKPGKDNKTIIETYKTSGAVLVK